MLPISTGRIYVGTDTFQHHVYKRSEPALVRFTDYHPRYQVESFCYNLLLKHVSFRSENDLLSMSNSASYAAECITRGLISSDDGVENFVAAYADYHLYADHDRAKLIYLFLQALPDPNLPSPSNEPQPDQFDNILSTHDILHEFDTLLHDNAPNTEQQNIINALSLASTGLHIITGGPGCGKLKLTSTLPDSQVKLF
ncbi:hypothetical protein Vretifemale_7166 [Volvox reticuliferus]|nr:hypothetical protein Vretifemale_7166 [Volvox reticuliferus]